MTKRPSLTDITTVAGAPAAINANWREIEAAFDNTLSRDGCTPNQMQADIDLDSNDILNVKDLRLQNLYINGDRVVEVEKAFEVTFWFNDRQAFLDWAATATPVDGQIANVGGLQLFEYESGVTHIGDLPNWKPHGGIVQPQHFANNMGVVDPSNPNGFEARAATLEALAYLAVIVGGVLYFSKGEYLFGGNSAGWTEIKSAITIVGDGMNETILNYKTVNGAQGFWHAGLSGPFTDDVTFSDLSIVGSWGDGGDYTTTTGQLIRIITSGDIRITRVRLRNPRNLATSCKGANSFLVDESEVIDSAGGGWRCSDVRYGKVSNCYFKNVNDDTVDMHSLDATTHPEASVDRSLVAVGNNIVDSQGIVMLGAKNTIVAGNTLTRCIGRAVKVGFSGGSEGNTAPVAVNITGNTITDLLSPLIFSPVSGARAIGIVVEQLPPTQVGGSGTDYVGSSDGSGGVVEPWPYLYTNGIDTAPAVIPGAYWINVSENVITRTIEPTANYSDYGFGTRLGRTGPSDPTVTASDMMEEGILFVGSFRDSKISGNIISGAEKAIFFEGTTGLAAAQYNNVVVSDNILTNFTTTGIDAQGPGLLVIRGNAFDGDPYNIHADRLANGKWGAGYTNNTALTFVSARAIVSDNSFRNVGRIISGTLTLDTQFDGNQIICDPNATGDDADNIGIRNISTPDLYGYVVIEDGDPSSSTFNRTQQPCLLTHTSQPTAGKYVFGHFVRNVSPSLLGSGGSKYIVHGWIRGTTGTGHILNTDWFEARTLTGA